MFTGIVEEAGRVLSASADAGGRRLRVACDEVGEDLHRGQSIAVSGVCLTVEAFGELDGAGGAADGATREASGAAADGDGDGDSEGAVAAVDGEGDGDAGHWFEVFLAAETVERTYLDDVEAGDLVNLERAVPVDGRLDGHVVQGHVDCTTEIVAIRSVGEREARRASNGPRGDQPRGGWEFEFAVPPRYGKYVAEKGSVALDGISLTVAERSAERFAVAVIPTTCELTNFREKAVGDPVHVEIDVLARYAERLLADRERAEVPVRGVEPGEVRGGEPTI